MSLKHPSVVATTLALAGVLAFSGCERPGGTGGTTTIIQQPPAVSGTPSASTIATPKITPVDDPRELCHQVRSKTRELSLALKKYWSLVSGSAGKGKSDSDPDVHAAANQVIDLAGKTTPGLEGIVGGNAPSDVSGVVRQYIQTLVAFANSVEEVASDSEMSAAASNFGHALDALDATCKA